MIKFEKHVIFYLEELINTLFKSHYFSSISAAENYLDKILDFIHSEINAFPAKSAPIELGYLGKLYIFYKPNNNTTWFIFFFKEKGKYVISGIINNHIEESKWLNQ